MITHSGRAVFPENTTAPTLDDIAIGLGRTARFAGQTKHYYNVLAHTIVVMHLVDPGCRTHAMLHDASEAIVGDVPTTWKTGAARDREGALQRRIYLALDIELPDDDEKREVARADYVALVAEAHVLGHSDTSWWEDAPDEEAMLMTRGQLRVCLQYLRASTALFAFRKHMAYAQGVAK